MDVSAFILQNGLAPETLDARACLESLLNRMEAGLRGEGNIPMIPSWLPADVRPVAGVPCCVLDAGGTNLRVGKAVFDQQGNCTLSDVVKTPMPGTQRELSFREFYGELAEYVRATGCPERVGFCFSYNVVMDRTLDGILESWCKEVRVPEATGKPVGASLAHAVGEDCQSVRVLNDTTAALLGARSRHPETTVAVILGTGINTCYVEQCSRIPKLSGAAREGAMIVSTEAGEFRGIPKSPFDEAVIAASDDPSLAHGEKQCAGAYLGSQIHLAWKAAAEQGILDPVFSREVSLPQISDYLAGGYSALPQDSAAREIARVMVHRGAKIAAILTAGTVLMGCRDAKHCSVVVEGSQFQKLTGFSQAFSRELSRMLQPYGKECTLLRRENSCLVGAAMAAFARPL